MAGILVCISRLYRDHQKKGENILLLTLKRIDKEKT
jgi:hypothetical protein